MCGCCCCNNSFALHVASIFVRGGFDHLSFCVGDYIPLSFSIIPLRADLIEINFSEFSLKIFASRL